MRKAENWRLKVCVKGKMSSKLAVQCHRKTFRLYVQISILTSHLAMNPDHLLNECVRLD